MTARKKRLKQSIIILGALLVIGGSAFFVAPKETVAKEKSEPDVFIRQVQIAGTTTNEDFAVIQNNEDCALDLSGWKLRKRTKDTQVGEESSVKAFSETRTILPPHETFLWANSRDNFSKILGANEESTAILTENNSLALLDASNTIIDSLSWGSVTNPFRSDEPNTANPSENEMITRTSKAGAATIENTTVPHGKTFDTRSLDFCGASKDRAENSRVVLSEILANPAGDESKGEFIELENRSEKTIDLSGWKLRDASKTGKYIFPEESIVESRAFLTLFRTTFIFALNNSDETVTLEDAKGNTADTTSWETARENISLARDGARWRNTKFVTPNETNRFGHDPSAKTTVPKKGFAGIPLAFSAKITDKDRDKTKVTWDFGDGHKSYKKEASHTFEKKGRYHVKLTATDGIADTVKTFRMDIKKYAAPKVRITSLVPNPAGADSKNEYLVFTNRSKKEVNLKGWKIATKSKRTSKNFVNHTIAKDFIVKPGESKKLTAQHAAFTLGNTRQYLELRDPRGKTVQSLHYKLEKSVSDDAELFKLPNEPWQWRTPIPLDAKTKGV